MSKLSGFLKLILISLLILVSYHTYASPAYPHKVRVAAGRGYVYITLRGDENCKYGVTDEGYTVIQSSDDQWFYATDESGKTTLSTYPLLPKEEENEAQKTFLLRQRKGIVPTQNMDVRRISPLEIQETSRNKAPAIGDRRVLVIMMQFRDTKFVKSNIQFDALFNQEGYREDGALGSVRDYYDFVSYGQLQLHCDVIGPFTASQNMAYYGGNSSAGGNDKNPYELFREAISHAVDEVDLHEYDANGDGYVDNVHIIYAGYGEEAGASSNAIWAHEMTFQAISVGGMKIDRYSCSPELRGKSGGGISRIGPHCHEIGHALGAMDYYDTDYDTGGYYLGTGDWDIMASGSWNNDGISPANFNPYVKVYDFGWTSAKRLEADADNEVASSVNEGNIYRIDTGANKDYFLLEYREGSYFDASEPGSGLLIFHIGPKLETKAEKNTINSTYPQQCYIVCASSTYARPSASSGSYGKINSAGCPYPGSTNKSSFTDTTTPAAVTFGGANTGISLTNIKIRNGVVGFHYGDSNTDIPDTPDNPDDEQHEGTWNDDFENMALSDFWSYSDISGLGEVKIETKLFGSDTPKNPNALSGRSYMSFRAATSNSIGRARTKGCLSGKKISLDKNKQYMLSVAVRRYSKLEDSKDEFTLRIYTENETIEQTIKVTNNTIWRVIEEEIPIGNETLRFELEPSIDSGAIIFFDDIRLVETNLTNVIAPQSSDDPSSYYDVWGRFAGFPSSFKKIVVSGGKKMLR